MFYIYVCVYVYIKLLIAAFTLSQSPEKKYYVKDYLKYLKMSIA